MNILTSNQKTFLNKFFQSSLKNDFYLTGGTALAEFYLQHRLSVDLDLFTVNQKISFDHVNLEFIKIANELNWPIKNQVASPTFLRYFVEVTNEVIKIDCVKDVYIHFGQVETREDIRIDSLENIAVNKILAIFGRTEAKDFIDLFFILEIEKKFNFEELFLKAQKKDLGLNEFYFANALTQIEKLDIFPSLLKNINTDEMKKYFSEKADSLFKKIKPGESL